MSNYYEIDFLDVDSKRSGDAITIRYELDGNTYIHVVDGGFQATGDRIVEHINSYYGQPTYIHHVVATHPDGDHAGGLRTVLEEYAVGTLWMFRPWLYVDTLLEFFPRFSSAENLARRLREIYPNIDALEEISVEKRITINEPREGTNIGAFTVVSPSIGHYLYQVIESDKTPESVKIAEEDRASASVFGALKRVVNAIRAAWGEEIFSSEETSAENEMSVVQYAELCGNRILLTGDAGRSSLMKAADYLESQGATLPGLKVFQVPHHGSRRNVSTEVLDRWLGTRRASRTEDTSFEAIISASKEDEDHPRKAVVRACIHRGGTVISTEGNTVCSYKDAPSRGWSPAVPLPYPEDQEEP